MALQGIWQRPYIDLEGLIAHPPWSELHEEICLGLLRVDVSYTGGSHESMGIVPSAFQRSDRGDYGRVLRTMAPHEWLRFVALADDPNDVWGRVSGSGPEAVARLPRDTFGEESDVPLSRRQMLYLKYRYGVYFPWKVYFEMLPGGRWGDKHIPDGKAFEPDALLYFPRTVAFIRRLPFAQIGSVKLLGLESHDDGTVHRDGVPGDDAHPWSGEPSHFLTFCPAGNKRLFLWDDEAGQKVPVGSRLFWFNDADYHGVEADPYFRYSVRVDGVFQAEFLEMLRRNFRSSVGVRRGVEGVP